MQCPDTNDISEQKINRISELLEQVLIDVALSVLYQLRHNHNHRSNTCYKSDCPMRDDIPF